MLERSVLENKDRDQLLAIAQALGVKATSRAKKADLIGKILESTGVIPPGSASGGSSSQPSGSTDDRHEASSGSSDGRAVTANEGSSNGESSAGHPDGAPPDGHAGHDGHDGHDVDVAVQPPADAQQNAIVLGPDGEPLAEWELELLHDDGQVPDVLPLPAGSGDSEESGGQAGEGEGEARRRRRRRRGRSRDVEADGVPIGAPAGDAGQQRQDRPERFDRPERLERFERQERQERPDRIERGDRNDGPQILAEPVDVSGYLDLREEGYGFLRVNGYLPSKDDAYVNVKQTRQYGLRKGDFVSGTMRPAARNEKNAALIDIQTVNGIDPEQARLRRRFEDLTPLFPDKKLSLSSPNDPTNMTARIIDLISPIGKGQRGIIVSPPKAGKTTIMKTIATAIERNNPEVKLIVLLIDERPEEVTDMRRTVKGEVISSTFDRPSEEHTHVAELAIEKAKRLVEAGEDVVIILDGITRLARAYNLASPTSGRVMSGGIDAGALYPPKKFFGAARNVEEGGSLTILATALVETNSRMDDAIFEEFKGTGNMELRLDRKLAERRIYPAIDVDASSTRHEELLFDRRQLQMVWRLRRVLSGLAAEGNAAPGLELLIDRLKTFRTNDEFLAEVSKQPM
jgi:transcription termination factor Rho